MNRYAREPLIMRADDEHGFELRRQHTQDYDAMLVTSRARDDVAVRQLSYATITPMMSRHCSLLCHEREPTMFYCLTLMPHVQIIAMRTRMPSQH